MEIITAIFEKGVFTPEGNVDLAEGTRVVLQVRSVPPAETTEQRRFSPLVPDEPLETVEHSAPIDLPMPPGGVKVKAHEGAVLLPDPPLIMEQQADDI